MSETETRLLAQHMGHDLNIHVKHYALQTNLLERAKVAKVLVAIQNGNSVEKSASAEAELPDVRDADLVEPSSKYCVIFASNI